MFPNVLQFQDDTLAAISTDQFFPDAQILNVANNPIFFQLDFNLSLRSFRGFQLIKNMFLMKKRK